ncbi:MAG: peptide-methionine (S)-S-oxide reductase MsrA [Pseudomonadota bacterium]|nr:peptide-methionine (S)-S-oxide reductase [Pseudomonadales bacterium]MDY6921974.1 peptide-methionine (S)-S-oxide reductase MsrA [Pseudomonadota bacterium]
MINWKLGNRFKNQLPSVEEALPGRTEPLAVSGPHTVLGTELKGPYPPDTEVAYFGMGCFWGAEKLFWNSPGVYTTAVGYGAGITPNPTYEEVCSGRTGHNEVVRVVYWSQQVSYAQLLKLFFENHNPCEGMRQGNDVGTQYRSGIYPVSAEQETLALRAKATYDAALQAAGAPVTTTEVVADAPFYFAESYHQQYLAKNPLGYCPNHSCDATGLPPMPADPLLSPD